MAYLGYDPGYGNTKLYGAAGSVVLPSHVAMRQNERLPHMEGIRRSRPPLAITVDDRAYYVGRRAHDWGVPVESLDYTRLRGTPAIRATLYAALSQYEGGEASGRPLDLLVGLPLGALGEAQQAASNEVRQWLCGEHAWLADGIPHTVTIDRVLVTAQATAALYDYVLDENGRFHPQRGGQLDEEIGIVSVGFNTLELMVIRARKPVTRFSGGSKYGVRYLLQALYVDGTYSWGELDDRLRDGRPDDAAAQLWLTGLSGQIEKLWGDRWRHFAQVVIVGGGALLLRSRLTTFFRGRCFLPDDPVTAVARGMYKMLQLRAGRQGKR